MNTASPPRSDTIVSTEMLRYETLESLQWCMCWTQLRALAWRQKQNNWYIFSHNNVYVNEATGYKIIIGEKHYNASLFKSSTARY